MTALVTALAEGESPETLAVMVVELRRTLAEVDVELGSIRREFGAPGEHGYSTAAGRILDRLYRLIPPISDALAKVAP